MIITLLTDFGTRDTYVGVMKGIIKGIAPQAELVDLTHAVPPQDVTWGALALKHACRYFPPGTIHLAVVDPGVGSARLPVAAQIGDYFYVCPDNGLLSYVLAEEILARAVALDHTQYHRPPISRTFHGRDIFAPVAAHLASGVPFDALGTPLDTLVMFPSSQPTLSPETALCHVISIDIYGNALTDLAENVYHTWRVPSVQVQIQVGERDVFGPASSYSDVPIGMPVALFGSTGNLEVAVRNGSAAATFGLQRGDRIRLHQNRKAVT